MTPEEIALKFASASATCRGHDCPYAAQCRGSLETCKLKEISLIVRSMILELEKVRTEYELLRQGTVLLNEYVRSLEQINAKYYKTICRFIDGYRPPKKTKPYVPKIGSGRGRKKKNLIDRDGDERYAMPEEPKPPKPQVVII